MAGEPRQPGARVGRPGQRVGLALSGGGFRAAFFHLGVLARLAELAMLRRVEVISTVSGGSIIGALYYIRLRDLLQTKDDGDVTDDDYAAIVARMEEDFLRGVETNVRARAFLDPWKNLRMVLGRYSRSDRLGELYDEVFYRPAWNEPLFGDPPSEPRRAMIEMRELLIRPPGADEMFNPLTENRGRRAPVPILVVNATSLNTGHNWRFEAVGMGEPDRAEVGVPEDVGQMDPREDARREIDRNDRLRWTRYSRLDEYQARFELGLAVAASAGVPTLFPPLPVTRLFARSGGGGLTVQLVDGGVHDNQGIAGLVEFRCKPLIVSDASGYLPDQAEPPTRSLAVAGRTIGIYGDRVREEQLVTARLADESRPLGLMHLRKGITGYAIAPLGPDGKPIEEPRPEPPADFRGERFGVDARVQDALSRVRTDLDSFSEVEAYSLMLNGYRQTGPNVEHLEIEDQGPELGPRPWSFTAVADAAETGADAGYLRHLQRAKSRFGKPVWLTWAGRLLALALLALAAGLVAAALASEAVQELFARPIPLWVLLILVAFSVVLVVLYVGANLPRPVRWLADGLYGQVFPFLFALPLWLLALVVLAFSRIFVNAGRIGRVLRP